MNQDATEYLLAYLEAKRNLWNVHFSKLPVQAAQCDVLDRYHEIDRALFNALVAGRFGKNVGIDAFRNAAIDWLRVVPRADSQKLGLMISDPITGANRAWNEKVYVQLDSRDSLAFIEFFDWEEYRHPCFPYIRARFIESHSRPEFAGREALVEVRSVIVCRVGDV